MTTDDILDVIDHALEDYEVSVDAMRWVPEPAIRMDADVQPFPEADIQPFLEAIRRDIRELAALIYDNHGALITGADRDWWVRWLDAATQADRR